MRKNLSFTLVLIILTWSSIMITAHDRDLFIISAHKISLTLEKEYNVRLDTLDSGFVMLTTTNNLFSASYEVVDYWGKGSLQDTIRFLAYDEYCNPEFAKYETVILAFERSCTGEISLFRHLYFDIYRDKKGDWYSDYNLPLWCNDNLDSLQREVEFDDDIVFKSSKSESTFPIPFYIREKDTYIPKYGYHIDDLVKYLTHRIGLISRKYDMYK